MLYLSVEQTFRTGRERRITAGAVLTCCYLVCTLLPCAAWAQSQSGYQLLGRGVNYGNMLEAPVEGAWGVRFQDEFPALIREAGFDSVRLPVRWSSAAAKQAPFEIDAGFLARVKHIVKLNLDQGLNVVLNIHHFDELYEDPEGQRDRFLAIWRQLAEEFQEAGPGLFFELLNEPHGRLDAAKWNRLLAECLAEVRRLHPQRWVIIGPDRWNNIHALEDLELPSTDRRLIVTVHYYLPFAFTHQGAGWVTPVLPTGVKWSGTIEEKAAVKKDLEGVAAWAETHDRPVYVGEFGAYQAADIASRAIWTAHVRQTCEELGFAWAYWELAAGFGILNADNKQWNANLRESLLPP